MRSVILFMVLSTLFIGWNYGNRMNEGDLYVRKNSIRGDSSEGLKIDPDSDGTDEITLDIAGDIITVGNLSLSHNATASGAGLGAASYLKIFINGVEYRIEMAKA